MNDTQLPLPSYSDTKLAELSPSKLADLLIEDHDRAPRNVIDACARCGDAMTEYLRQLHEDDFLWNEYDDDPEDIATGKWWLRLHTAMILGLIPGEQAGLLLVELMRRMSQEDDDLQDWLAGYWPALFLNKPGSAQPALRALCEDKNVDWYIRANAIETVISSAAKQETAVLEQALVWLAGIVTNEDEDWDLRLLAGNTLLDYPRAEYRALLENMADRQHGLGKQFDRGCIQKAYSETTTKPERFTDPWGFYEPDAIILRQIRWKEEDDRELQRALNQDTGYLSSYHDYEPYIRPEPKVGRNDPCPCGSGKKYKKCCITKNE